MGNATKGVLGGLAVFATVGVLLGAFFLGESRGQKQELEESGWQLGWTEIELVETEWLGVGIGFAKSSRDGSMIIERVWENSPAARAGLKEGDAIVGIDGKSTKELSPDQFNLLVGENKEGSRFLLAVVQDVFAGPKDIAIMREKIEKYPTQHSIVNIGERRAGYLQFPQYLTQKTPLAVGEALQKFEAEKVEVLVLDLRGTQGNFADSYSLAEWDTYIPAYTILQHFLREGSALFQWASTWGHSKVAVRSTRSPFFEGKIIVLVDHEADFSAALIANSLKFHRNALVILSDPQGNGYDRYLGSTSDYYLVKNPSKPWTAHGVSIFVGKIFPPDEQKEYEERGWKADVVVGHINTQMLSELQEVHQFLEAEDK